MIVAGVKQLPYYCYTACTSWVYMTYSQQHNHLSQPGKNSKAHDGKGISTGVERLYRQYASQSLNFLSYLSSARGTPERNINKMYVNTGEIRPKYSVES